MYEPGMAAGLQPRGGSANFGGHGGLMEEDTALRSELLNEDLDRMMAEEAQSRQQLP